MAENKQNYCEALSRAEIKPWMPLYFNLPVPVPSDKGPKPTWKENRI